MQHITLHQVVFSLITSPRIISKYSNKGWTVKLDIEMEIVAAGDSHAVAKCKYGSVFVPKGALKHITNLNYGQLIMEPLEIHKHRSEGGLVGEFIWGRIQFTPGKRHWWRIMHVDCLTE